MSIKNKNLNDKQESAEQAIKLINECVKKDEGFIVYTGSKSNYDIVSVNQEQYYIIIGTILMNAIQLNNRNSDEGFSKKELQYLLDKAEEFANKDDEDKTFEDMKNINDCLTKMLDGLKKKIENLKKKENGE